MGFDGYESPRPAYGFRYVVRHNGTWGIAPCGKNLLSFFSFFSSSVLPRTLGDIYGAGTWVFYGVSCIVKPNTGGVLGKGKRKKVPMALGLLY